MLKWAAVMLGSDNPDKLAEFYKKVFGDPMWEQGGYTGFNTGDTGLMVGPHDKVTGPAKEPERVIMNFATEDVPGEFERLKGLGATVIQEPYKPQEDSEMVIATLADPDGNYFQIAPPWEG